MVDFNKPQVGDPYGDVLQAFRDLLIECAKFQDGSTNTNVPVGAIRFSSANKRFEKWNGTSWGELIAKASDKYDINVDRVDGYDAGNGNGQIPVSNGTVNTNLNADLLDGQHGNYYATASAVASAQSTADSANNAAATANSNASGRVSKSGDTMSGQLTLPGGGSGSQAATVSQAQTLASTAESNAIAVANTKATPSDVALKLSKSGDTASELYNNGWFRSNGSVGWYSQTYGGGIWMNDTSWVRVYGSKGFLTDWHQFHNGGNIWTSSYGWLHDRFAAASHSINVHAYSGNTGDGAAGGAIAAALVQIASDNTVRIYRNTNCNCNCTCCFPLDTLITMADETRKRVAELVAGDQVKTSTGSWATVIEPIVCPVNSGEETVLVNGTIRMTREHLLRGEHGWLAIDTDFYTNWLADKRKDRDDIGIDTTNLRTIQVGDLIATEFGFVPITSIEHVIGAQEEVLRSIDLDGDRTFYANGYVVESKTTKE